VTPDNELNGLSLYGVGRGTVLDYIQIHLGLDDGIEFFGGTADVKHLLLTAAQDDSIDWDRGWQGRAQFLIVQQDPSSADNGIEADNNNSDHGLTPRSHPVISNMTLVGQGSDLDDAPDNLGWHARRGTAGEVHNSIFLGFDEEAFDIESEASVGQANSGDLTIEHSLVFDCDPNFPVGDEFGSDGTTVLENPALDEGAWFLDASRNNAVSDPMLADAFNLDAPDFQPGSGSPAASGGVVPTDSFFESVTYLGAVDPSGTPWYEGWTAFAVE
jgi:hypothetical protein